MSILDQHGKPYNPKPNCKHEKHMPDWPGDKDPEMLKMDEYEIRKKYPRFMGRCDDCGQLVILYASAMQYIMGDY